MEKWELPSKDTPSRRNSSIQRLRTSQVVCALQSQKTMAVCFAVEIAKLET